MISDPNRFEFKVVSRDPQTQSGYDQGAHAYRPAYVHPGAWTIQLEFAIQQSLRQLRAQLEHLNHPPPDDDHRPGHDPLHGGTHGGLPEDGEFDDLQSEIDELELFINSHDFHFRVEKVLFTVLRPGQPARLGPPIMTPVNQLSSSVQVVQQGRYRVTSIVTNKTNPAERTEKSSVFSLRDILVVAIGDSYASGEGNPDVPQTPSKAMEIYAKGSGLETLRNIGADFDDRITLETEFAQWQEPLAHHSYRAHPFYAAQAIQGKYADMLLGCTFLNFARTGALIDDGLLAPNPWLGDERRVLRLFMSDALSSSNPAGTLFPVVLRGVGTQAGQPASLDVLLGIGQIDEMERNIGERQIDFMTISIGGNDCGWTPAFAGIIKPFWDSESSSASEVLHKVSYFIETYLAEKFDLLHQRLMDMAHQPRFVLLTLYPKGFFGAGSADEPSLKRNCGIFDALDTNPLWESDSWFGIDDDEAIIIKHLANVLNDKLRDTVVRLNQSPVRGSHGQARTFQWVIVDHIDRDFEVHGYCADQTYFVGAEESFLKQGDWRGILHPNETGHRAYARRMAETMRKLISDDPASFKFVESLIDDVRFDPSSGGSSGPVFSG